MNSQQLLDSALNAGAGVLRLAPTWVPRVFLRPGGRLRLHPNDLYSLGPARGGIDERWLASTTRAANGPEAPEDEGLSYFEHEGKRALLAELLPRYEDWPVLCKLFDNSVPIPLHLHPNDEQVKAQGLRGKPEAYFFPPQYNLNPGPFPYSFFGLRPGTTANQVRRCLERWHEGDNEILHLSRAYKLETATSWQIDTGVLHAPGTMVTYEPQAASDAGAMFESICAGQPLPWSALVKNFPEEKKFDLDAILEWVDWDKNLETHFSQKYMRRPRLAADEETHRERWIVYGGPRFSARELTVAPGAAVTLSDPAPYGALVVQGHGSLNGLPAEVPDLIRYGQMTADEFFVTAEAARNGVNIVNISITEPLVILKHFGPGHPGAVELIQ
jgi:hypothetical protein